MEGFKAIKALLFLHPAHQIRDKLGSSVRVLLHNQ